MSRHIPDEIMWIQTTQDGYVFTGLNYRRIVQWKKMNQVKVFELPLERKLVSFLVQGDLIFALCQDGYLVTFDR